MAFYSTPKEAVLFDNYETKKWRILGGNVFGLDESGVVYSKGIRTQGNDISIKGERSKRNDGKWQQTELTVDGIKISFYDNADDIDATSSKSATWEQIIDKIKV